MLGSTGNCTRGAWRALLPLRMKIMPVRTALKTLDPMALCTETLSSSLLRNMQGTAGFDLWILLLEEM